MAQNAEAMRILTLVGKTPGFKLQPMADHGWKVIREPLGEFQRSVVKVSPNAHAVQLRNAITRLRGIGWEEALHDKIRDITNAHRQAGTDPHQEIEKTLLEHFRQIESPRNRRVQIKPGEETGESKEIKSSQPRLRHGKTGIPGGSAKQRAGQATPAGQDIDPRSFDEEPAPKVIDDLPVIRAEMIGLDRAFYLLSNIASYQRDEIPGKVADWEAAMMRGEWEPMEADPICIDVNGKLANGRHRIQALFNTGLELPFYVAYKVPVERFKKMDRGAKRTTGHTLQGLKKKSPNLLASVLRQAYLWFNVQDQEQWRKHPVVTEPQILATLEHHPGIEISVTRGRVTTKEGVRILPTASVMAHYLIARAQGGDEGYDLATDFMKAIGLRTISNLRHPTRQLGRYLSTEGERRQKKLIRERADGTRDERTKLELQMYLLMQAWNNIADGKEMGSASSIKPDFVIASPKKLGPNALPLR